MTQTSCSRKKTLLIVYHSTTGGTLQMARAAARGAACEPGVEVVLKTAQESCAEDVMEARGYIFGSPENLASVAGMMKDFFDRTYYAVLEKLNGRPYATLVCAGSDGTNAARQIERIATGWRLKAIAPPLIVLTRATAEIDILRAKTIDEPALQRCEELGATLAAGLALGIF